MHLLFQTTRPLGSETGTGDDDDVGPMGQAIQACRGQQGGSEQVGQRGHQAQFHVLFFWGLALLRPDAAADAHPLPDCVLQAGQGDGETPALLADDGEGLGDGVQDGVMTAPAQFHQCILDRDAGADAGVHLGPILAGDLWSILGHRLESGLESVAGPETLHQEPDHVSQPVLVVLSPPVAPVGQVGVVDQAAHGETQERRRPGGGDQVCYQSNPAPTSSETRMNSPAVTYRPASVSICCSRLIGAR